MLERLDGADEERAVADGNHDVGRDTAELLEGLVDVGLHRNSARKPLSSDRGGSAVLLSKFG